MTGLREAVRIGTPGPCLWGGVEGPVSGDCVPMAGIWGRERDGHATIRGDVVSLGYSGGGKKTVSSSESRHVA